MFKEGGSQKFLTAQDVKEHIEALWRKEKDLLDLVYGKFAPSDDGYKGQFETTSLGSKLFFVKRVLVPPTRFRPESEGAMGGSGGSGKAYLHAHSAMLLKIMSANLAMKDAIMHQNGLTTDTQV